MTEAKRFPRLNPTLLPGPGSATTGKRGGPALRRPPPRGGDERTSGSGLGPVMDERNPALQPVNKPLRPVLVHRRFPFPAFRRHHPTRQVRRRTRSQCQVRDTAARASRPDPQPRQQAAEGVRNRPEHPEHRSENQSENPHAHLLGQAALNFLMGPSSIVAARCAAQPPADHPWRGATSSRIDSGNAPSASPTIHPSARATRSPIA